MAWLEALVGTMVFAGVLLLHDAWVRRDRRPEMAERLTPFQPESLVTEEARRWLDTQ